MSLKYDILTSTRKIAPRMFIITLNGEHHFTGNRLQTEKELDLLFEQDEIDHHMHRALVNSLRGY